MEIRDMDILNRPEYEKRYDLLDMYDSYMHLKMFIDSSDNELVEAYENAVKNHNLKLFQNMRHIDAGFDLLAPSSMTLNHGCANKVDYQVICSAEIYKQISLTLHTPIFQIVKDTSRHNTGFYIYPRSSISKTNIRLANNTGIIDAGYRGHLIGMFDCINAPVTVINKLERQLQICAPGLIPIYVELVKSREELGNTVRGDGGFGSTGK